MHELDGDTGPVSRRVMKTWQSGGMLSTGSRRGFGASSISPENGPVEMTRRLTATLVATLVLSAVPSAKPVLPTERRVQQSNDTPSSAPIVTVLALDAQGRPVLNLGPDDFEVKVDGTVRRIVDAGLVFRGTGAEAAARRAATAAGFDMFAERERAVIVVVDESGFPRGSEGPVRDLVGALLDLLGPSDLATVVRLPKQGGDVRLAADRKGARDSVGKITGRAAPTRAVPPEQPLTVNDGEARLAPRYVSPSGDSEPAQQDDPLALFARLLDRLRKMPGPKTVLLVSPAPVPAASSRPPGRANANMVRCLDAAAASQTTVHTLLLPRGDRDPGSPAFERVAIESGGSVLRLSQDGRELDLLATWMAGFYMLSLDAGSRDHALHDLQVTSRRAGLQVRVARRWTQDGVRAGIVAVTPASSAARAPVDAGAGHKPPAAASNEASFAEAPDPELDRTLAAVGDYLQSYLRDYTNVVAEERYDQQLEHEAYGSLLPGAPRPADSSTVTRVLKSDLLMVSTPSLGRWVPFRDVFEVDGKPVRDRDDRLKTLLLDAPKDVAGDARRITEESARYNLGAVDRTTNVPTLALELLSPLRRQALRLARHGEDSVDGIRALRIDFEEKPDMALIRTTTGGGLPSHGSFWVDPTSGRILKTDLRTEVGGAKMEVTVVYRRASEVGLWLPSEMHETYTESSQKLRGVARYSHFRRFQVTTEQTVKTPD